MKAIDKIKNLVIAGTQPEVKLITFKHAAAGVVSKRKGYCLTAIMEGSRREILTIEPINRAGEKWLFYGSLTSLVLGYSSTHYATNIHQVIKALSKK